MRNEEAQIIASDVRDCDVRITSGVPPVCRQKAEGENALSMNMPCDPGS